MQTKDAIEGTVVREVDAPADKALVHVPERLATRGQLDVPAGSSPMEMLAMVVRQGGDPEKLKMMMELAERYEANEARKAYASAFVRFKSEAVSVLKNKGVSFETSKGVTSYKHATLDNACDTLIPILQRHGFAHHWKPETPEKGRVRVSCTLRHELGHEESVTMDAGIDDSGGKNAIQAIGSATAYLERYTFLAITGTATRGQDDDGKGAGGSDKQEVVPDAAGKKALEACGSLRALQEAWKALTVEQRKTLGACKDECKARIKKADEEAAK